MDEKVGERELLLPLLVWLRKSRWIRDDTLVVEELPWHGRRIDLVTLSKSASCSSYELKLSNTRRALEQSFLNCVSFDRSSVVMVSLPSGGFLEQAASMGVGVFRIELVSGKLNRLVRPRLNHVDEEIRSRLRDKIASGAGRPYV
jgi:hypothetical protein